MEIVRLKENTISEILLNSQVICSTCVSSDNQILERIRFPLVIIDESTQAIEPAALIPIQKGSQQLILVGDPNQLNPQILDDKSIPLKESLFKRLMKAGLPLELLNVQYRMHPGLSEFPSEYFYKSKIINGVTENDRKVEKMKGLFIHPKIPFLFINATSEEDTLFNSKINRQQIEICRILFNQLKTVFSLQDIGIISPYSAQVGKIKKEFQRMLK